MTFTPYEGWEDDVREVATVLDMVKNHGATVTAIPHVGQPETRLLAAFEPPKCRKCCTIRGTWASL